MDLIYALDSWGTQALAELTANSPFLQIAVRLAAQYLIAVPFIVLFFLWRNPEPTSHRHSNQKAALMAVLTVFLSLAAKTLITFVYFRVRPYVADPTIYHLDLQVDPASFPSGHTLIAFSVAFSLWHSELKKAGGWLLLVAAFVAAARVFAGVHYPTDILGGIVVAYLASAYLHREASSIRKYLPNQ